MTKVWVIAGAIAAVLAVLVGTVVVFIASPIVLLTGGLRGGATSCVVTVGDTAANGDLAVPTASGTSLTLSTKQLGYARTILAVGAERGVTSNGILIALITALQESGLKVYANTSTYPESAGYDHDANGSDHDSVGIFQQRPKSGWGSVKQLMDPTYSAQAFFGGPQGPNSSKKSPRGLLDINNWQGMSPGQAAQTVQVSAHPDRYDKWVPAAQHILESLGGVSADCATGSAGGWAAPNGKTGQDLIDYAEQFVGKVPYSGACGSRGSPSGWCCTGFVYWVYHQVLGVDLPGAYVDQQTAMAHPISPTDARAGDLIAYGAKHIGIYDGKGGIIHSPDWGRKLEHNPSYRWTVSGYGPTFYRVNGL